MWEYRFVTGSFNLKGKPKDKFVEELNALGREGWELVGISDQPALGTAYQLNAALKRPLGSGGANVEGLS